MIVRRPPSFRSLANIPNNNFIAAIRQRITSGLNTLKGLRKSNEWNGIKNTTKSINFKIVISGFCEIYNITGKTHARATTKKRAWPSVSKKAPAIAPRMTGRLISEILFSGVSVFII